MAIISADLDQNLGQDLGRDLDQHYQVLLGYIEIGQRHNNRSTLNPTRYLGTYLAGSSEVQHQQCYTSLDSAR